jgi:hypothetical protein
MYAVEEYELQFLTFCKTFNQTPPANEWSPPLIDVWKNYGTFLLEVFFLSLFSYLFSLPPFSLPPFSLPSLSLPSPPEREGNKYLKAAVARRGYNRKDNFFEKSVRKAAKKAHSFRYFLN